MTSFSTQRHGDADCANGQAIRDAHWEIFGRFSAPGYDVEDFDVAVHAIKSAVGITHNFAKKLVLAFSRLQDLPKLRALQADTRVMDVAHLTTINSVMEELGPEADPEIIAKFDARLVKLFTPRRVNQELPAPGTVTKVLRELIRRFDPSRAYDPKKRKARENDADTFAIADFLQDGRERTLIQLLTDNAVGARVRESVLTTARELKTSMYDAAVKLLTGEVQASPNVVLHLFAPKDREAGDPIFIPGLGWTNPEDTATVEEWLETGSVGEVDLDTAADHTLAGYAPNAAMRAAAFARDGTCIFPGCTRGAEHCQLDHRIPYDEGGATTVSNLYSLCAHHHNMKTDRRAFYVPDPVTGDIVWLFEDGTYTVVEPSGLLANQITPTTPRWRSSLQSVRNLRSRIAEFNAKCHTVVDRFDNDLNIDLARAEIAKLEEEYGLHFPIKFEMPEMPTSAPWEDEPVPHFDDSPPDPFTSYLK